MDLNNSKLVKPDQLVSLRREWKKNGRQIVFTNGCFDILHAGHVYLLQQAKSLGDILILGLNSDESVRRLKGPDRPIQNEVDRAYILAGMAAVDYVVFFGEDTPLQLIRQVQPDVLVKGGDYSPDQVVGASEVQHTGGTVKIIPLLSGRSTTKIASRMEKKIPRDKANYS